VREELAIRVLGHSGLDLDCSGYRIVCDPWLSPRGAFLGTRHPFPDNTMIDPASLHDAPALYISHPHEDHYDEETLRAYPKSVTAIVAKFPGDVLAKKLAALGFANIVELEEWQPHVLADGVTVRVLLDPTRYMPDSCLVVEQGRHVLVNQNYGKLAWYTAAYRAGAATVTALPDRRKIVDEIVTPWRAVQWAAWGVLRHST
jgi:UDP-MurNAc hydroxylase